MAFPFQRPIAGLAVAAALGLGGPAAAEPYVIDKSHAHVTFSVSHLGFSSVQGQFREFDAQIDFNPEAVEDTQVRFVVEVGSIETFWAARDRDLRGRNFFDAERFPQMVFESRTVVPTGADTAEVTGDLTIRGVTKPVTLNARLNKLGPSPFDPARTIAGFAVSGQIDRRDFGMTYAAPAVGAIVPIEIHFEMSPAR